MTNYEEKKIICLMQALRCVTVDMRHEMCIERCICRLYPQRQRSIYSFRIKTVKFCLACLNY